MKPHRAILIYETLLREFQKYLSRNTAGFEAALETGLGYLAQRMNLMTVSVFWWDPSRRVMQMEYTLHSGVLMEGEEEIPLESGGALWPLLQNKKPVVLSTKPPWVAYLPLCQGDEFIGAVRLIRARPLPRGAALLSLPRFIGSPQTNGREYPLLEDLADILSLKLQEIVRDENYRRKAQIMEAGAEVAAAVIETPRLKEMLEIVSKSIVRHLGFDRVRFYLIDQRRTELQGALGLQMPNRLLDLENEKHPLEAQTNALVDAVLAGSVEASVTSGGKVIFVPLIAQGQVVGCMAVDNLLSQQLIDEGEVTALKSLATQIGTAIINARLFEDIEQQAITDGLTKLYVYRYFQQRLKEELDRADRYRYSIALVMMDVDNFKQLNDTHGHLLGDKVLEMLSQDIRTNIRRIDLAARYGGDEFIILLPEITEQETWLMGARLLNALKQHSIKTPSGVNVNVLVTLGIAMYPADATVPRDLIEAADKALYWAKKNNRGDICFYKNITPKP